MKEDLIYRLRNATKLPALQALMDEAADEICLLRLMIEKKETRDD